MTLTRKDAAATALTILVVLTFFATHERWSLWLVGGSHRWAAGVVLMLGLATCALGSPGSGIAMTLCAMLGVLALALAVLALATGSLTALSFLVADTVALWAIATLGHVRRHGGEQSPYGSVWSARS